jgi:hypothetical protein
MAAYPDLAYSITTQLFGPDSPVPGWAWAAVLAMIFWGLLVASREENQQDGPPRHDP